MNIHRYIPIANILWLAVILGVLISSLFVQFFVGEQPCRLCTWQRMSMIFIAAVLLLNIKFGQQSRNYGLILIFALFGACVSTRQILSYIMPGSLGFGPAIFGMHMYTWALLVFVCSIAAAAIMLAIGIEKPHEHIQLPQPLIKSFFGLTLAVTLTFSVATFFQCGLEVCPAATEYSQTNSTQPLSIEDLCCPDDKKK